MHTRCAQKPKIDRMQPVEKEEEENEKKTTTTNRALSWWTKICNASAWIRLRFSTHRIVGMYSIYTQIELMRIEWARRIWMNTRKNNASARNWERKRERKRCKRRKRITYKNWNKQKMRINAGVMMRLAHIKPKVNRSNYTGALVYEYAVVIKLRSKWERTCV